MKRWWKVVAGMLLPWVVAGAFAGGEHVWSWRVGGSALADNMQVNSVAVDASDAVIAAGQQQASLTSGCAALTSAGDWDVLVEKFTSAGVVSWVKRFGSTGSDVANGVATDSSGNVFIVGQFSGTVNFGGSDLVSAGLGDIFLVKLSSAGAHVWSKRFGGTGVDLGIAVAVDGSGNVVIAGSFGQFGNGQTDFGGGVRTSAGNPDIFVAKYNSAGTYVWDVTKGSTSSDTALSVAVDSGGNALLAGYFQGTVDFGGGGGGLVSAGGRDAFLVKYAAADGAHVWSKRFGGTTDDQANGVAVGPSDVVVVVGPWNGTINFGGSSHTSTGGTDIFVAKFSSAGAWTWDKVYGTGDSTGDTARAVSVDGSGNVVFTGYVVNWIDFGGGIIPGNSTYQVLVVKLNSSGTYVWAHEYGELYDDFGYSVDTDSGGNVVVGGAFFDSIDFVGGTCTLHSPSQLTDGFVVQFLP